MIKRGFTLIEVLVALAIMLTALTLVGMSFFNIVNASREGEAMLNRLHHGEQSLSQLVSALRSAAFFSSTPEKYAFWLENGTAGRYPGDIISWVTSSTAFIPPDSPLNHGLHRIVVSIEDDEDGVPSLAVSAYPHLVDFESSDFQEVEPWIVSKRVKGLDCVVYNQEEDTWDEEWEKENTIPSFLVLTLYLDPVKKGGESRKITRLIPMPLSRFARQHTRFNDGAATSNENETPAPASPINITPAPEGPPR